MDAWLSQRRVWGNPRVYTNTSKFVPQNGVVSQTGFPSATGHVEYLYHGHDGGGYAFSFFKQGHLTKLWKGGKL